MLCDGCGKNPARIKMVTVVNGEKRETNLCPECAAKRNLSPKANGMEKLFSAIFGTEGASNESPACAKCGMKFATAVKKQRVGCPACYESFREQIAAGLKSRQGADTHIGRVPQARRDSREETILELQQEMDLAVACENFEEAAVLRDAIRALTATGEGGSENA